MQEPSRSLAFDGASNFRDLGGYLGLENRPLRWRRLFRSDHLGALSARDIERINELGVERVFDFRGLQERLGAPCLIENVEVHPLPIEPTVVQRLNERHALGQTLNGEEMVEVMQQTYRDFVRHNTERFGTLFQHLLASDAPLVFHCTAGKDRTGFAAALILLSLGVSHAVVMEDYLLTNQLFRIPAESSSGLAPEVRAILYRVQKEFLHAALEAVDLEHDGIEAYLTQALGVGPAERRRLAEFYLER